jgi:hypothetical protein
MSPNETPAGWYPDAQDPQLLRYWDGAAWTEHTAPRFEDAPDAQPTAPGHEAAAQPPAVRPQAAAPATQALDVYDQGFDLTQIPEQQRELYKQHTLTEFPTWLLVVLFFLTIGIFPTIYHGLKHSRLPQIKADDFTAGQGIGFLFIPFFNLYWLFRFWLSLTDKINLQYRLRNRPPPISRGLVLTMCILDLPVISYVTLLIGPLILTPIVVGIIQSAANGLAAEQQLD